MVPGSPIHYDKEEKKLFKAEKEKKEKEFDANKGFKAS